MIPPRHIRAALKAKYPTADFRAYFAFLAACPAQPAGRAHKHHMAPREQFPEYAKDKTNLIALTIDDHVCAHTVLGQACSVLSWANPHFIAAARGPKWRAAHAAGSRRMAQDPKWRAANAAAMRKLAQSPKWQAAHDAGCRRLAYKTLFLPEKKIICWYQAGMALCAIARKIGTGTCPNSKGRAPRVARIRNVLIRAGVYVKGKPGRKPKCKPLTARSHFGMLHYNRGKVNPPAPV